MKTETVAACTDIYTRVTDRILTDLERGVRPWSKPWSTNTHSRSLALPRRHNGEPYRGVNVVLLWAEASAKNFSRPTWMTYRQAVKMKAQVRKGERGSLVVYADHFTTTAQDSNGEDVEKAIPFLKAYTVFNVEQIDGLPDRYRAAASAVENRISPIQSAESFFAATGATVRHTGDQAYYSPSADVIVLPTPDAFRDAEVYAATKAHEFVHWTKHPSRLNRDLGAARFGDDGYAREELVAELGAAFVCALLGVSVEPRDDHAAYLAHWVQMLRADARAIVQAASHAQRAIDYLVSVQPGKPVENDTM